MKAMNDIEAKVLAHERLTFKEGVFLFESAPLDRLGYLADFKNKHLNKRKVFYNINRHINPTNICVLSCKFCSFSRKPGDAGAYAFTTEQILEKAGEAVDQNATEVHMVGGLHPRWSFKHYLEMLSAIKEAYPQLHIKAFTAVELDWFAKKTRSTVEDVLRKLMDVGLGSIPGGGAEIFHPEVRNQICDTKVSADQWMQTHKTAHDLGLHSNATMLYGHIEQYRHRVDHMDRLRTLQDQTNGFNAFIPLSFQPHDNDMGIKRFTFGCDDLRTIAVARLYLDNFHHIKSYWVMMGHDIAQLGLEFGANDLDGTVVEEKISKMAGGRSGMVMTQDYIHDLVEGTDSISVERDTVYKPIRIVERNTVVECSEKLRPMLQSSLTTLLNQIDEDPSNPKLLWQNHPSLNKPSNAIHLKAAKHLNIDWLDFEADLREIKSGVVLVTADENISAASYLRAICILNLEISGLKLYLDFETLPCLNPSRSGAAQNQDPRLKVASVLRGFHVDCVVLSANYEETFFDILHHELNSNYVPKVIKTLSSLPTATPEATARN